MRYKKLGRKRGLGKFTTLWLGEDHLLAVESTGYSEEYTRYYLKDIQAIVSRRSITGKLWNAALGTLLALSLIAGLGSYQKGATPVSIAAGSFGVLFLLLLLWNIFRGPTCSCQLLTSLGVEELPPLDRVRSVRQALERLRPLILLAQGTIKRAEMTELVRQAKDLPPRALPAARSAGVAAREPKNAASYRGGAHLAAFLLLLADAGLSSLQMLHNSKPLMSFSTLVSLAFLIAAIIALIKQKDHRVHPAARWMTWGGLAAMVTGATVGYFFIIFLNFGKLQGAQAHLVTQSDLIDFYAAAQPADHPYFAYFLAGYALVAAGMALIGLVGLARMRGSARGRL